MSDFTETFILKAFEGKGACNKEFIGKTPFKAVKGQSKLRVLKYLYICAVLHEVVRSSLQLKSVPRDKPGKILQIL